MSEDGRSVIKLKTEDFSPPSFEEQKLLNFSIEVEDLATSRLKQAASLSEFMLWHFVDTFTRPEDLGWILTDTPQATPEYTLLDNENKTRRREFGKEAIIAKELVTRANSLDHSDQKVRVSLKRVKEHGFTTYRVVAIFPRGTTVTDEVLDRHNDLFPRNKSGDIIYFTPSAACVLHACNDLYKAHRETNGVFYLPNLSQPEVQSKLGSNGTVYTYQKRTAEGVEKQNSENYILFGLLGGYSNERNRVRISDFLAKY